MNRSAMLFMALLVVISMTNFVSAEITCNDQGYCAGDGSPHEDVRCGNCHSCTYKTCCHVRFTNVNTRCYIDGWRSDEYKARWNE